MRKFLLVNHAHEAKRSTWSYTDPRRQTRSSAGYDFCSPYDVIIAPWGTEVIKTGYKAVMLPDEFLLLAIRSSLGFMGLELITNFGIIDSDYANNPSNDGEIMFRIRNTTENPYVILSGDRIGQGVFLKYLLTTNDNPINEDRSGASGSTGR